MPKTLIEQAKDHILNTCLPLLRPHHEAMVIPCLREDYAIYSVALELPEVKQALPPNIPVKLQVVTPDGKPVPDIIIATVEDAASGKLERYLKSMGL